MRIGIDGIPLGVLKTGVGHYTLEIARGVARAHSGDEFQVLSHIPFLPDIRTGISNEPNNLAFIQHPVNTATKHWWTIGLPHYIRNNSLDLFHGTNYDIPVWGGCATVLTIHDLSLLLFEETHEARRVRRARRRLPVMARRATRIIVPTESVKSEVCEHLPVKPEKVVVIPEAPRECFRPFAQTQASGVLNRLGIADSFILYVGAIEPRKNLLTLVRAFEEVYRTSQLRPQLVIAGPTGWLYEDLFDYVSKSFVKDRLLMTGYLGDEDLRALYSTCSVMCYPALYEGAGLPPLEAMACGAPVITTTAGAIAEMVGDGALLVAPREHEALAKAIMTVMTEPAIRNDLIQRGLKRASQFTWERAGEMTFDVYLQALSER